MKLPRALAVAPVILLVALAASACIGTENPQGWASPVFDNNTVYFLQSKDRLGAAPITSTDQTITLDWSFPDKNRTEDKDISLKAVYGEPVIDGDRLYFSSYSGGVFALNKTDGRPVWRMKDEIKGHVVGGVAVGANVLAFGTTDGHLYVVNKADKSPAPGWNAKGRSFGEEIWATPIIKGDTLYVATMGGDVHALSVKDGSELWEEPFHTSGAVPDITLMGDRLFVASLNRNLYEVSSADGAEIGQFKATDWVWTQPAFQDDHAYFGDFAGKVYDVDITDMQNALWSLSLGDDRVKSSPGIVDNVLIVADRQPTVHFIDIGPNANPEQRQLNEVAPTAGGTIRADVAVHDGFAYLSTTKGKLLRADPKQRSVFEVLVGNRQ